MTQEEKNLLLKDLCARLQYGIFVEDGRNKLDDGPVLYTVDYHPCINDCKTYLRPMSSMTEEEAKEIAILHDIKEKDILSVKVKSDYIDVIVDDGFCSTERITIWYDEIVSSIKCFDWLNKNMFDYHGLISMGLTLEAPEGMYDKKSK